MQSKDVTVLSDGDLRYSNKKCLSLQLKSEYACLLFY